MARDSNTFIPSIAEVVIPPAYPAPSPHGNIPFILDIKYSSLNILIGDDVLDSTPNKIGLLLAKSVIFLSNTSCLL